MSELNTSKVKRKKAFLGAVTTQVRSEAEKLCKNFKGGSLIDIGCGNGLFFAAVGNLPNTTFFGLDYSLELLKEAREIFKDNNFKSAFLIKGNGFYLPFAEKSFDGVYFLNTLLNLKDKNEVEKMLEGLMKITKKTLVFDFRNRKNPYMASKYAVHNFLNTFPTKAYTTKEIGEILKKHSFRIKTLIPVGSKILPFAYVVEAERI
ncbi:class I SAM-dependent methyltransferase [bacterium]|nr:class I SAM-dependent methyltransferase [bacterium]